MHKNNFIITNNLLQISPRLKQRLQNADLRKSSNNSGKRKFKSDHNSDKLFCSGVPVSRSRCVVLYKRSSLK